MELHICGYQNIPDRLHVVRRFYWIPAEIRDNRACLLGYMDTGKYIYVRLLSSEVAVDLSLCYIDETVRTAVWQEKFKW